MIQKLQNTQLLQKAAYDDLEGALNGNATQDNFMNMSAQQRMEFSPVKSPGSDQKGGRPQTSGGASSKRTPQNA